MAPVERLAFKALTGLLPAAPRHGARPAPETGRESLRGRIRAHILEHLDDPDLTPATVAAAHYISTRSLHRLFQGQEYTVAEWIRVQRLDRCRRDLVDPSLRDRSIRAIANRWCLTSAPHFSRAFRAAYGLSPENYRRRHYSSRSPLSLT
ncbi:helix-turn-helix domain-containing protein [Nonomuraea sp. NPDC050451]|uniref:helix-turn-helix domain-containing protein n=1 Tax=Nonomuraea sp. NPDC050451 TaxID=3364364 RepID=UPI00378F8196